MDDGPEGEARARRSRPAAQVAFLLAITSLLLAWWRVTWSSGGTIVHGDVRPFRPEAPLTTTWAPWATGLLVAAAIVLLFVRIAARSDKHEPPAWRRDLGVAAVLVGAALASCLLWPADVPSFWGGRTYMVENVTTSVHEVAMPGLGWWVGLLAFLLLLGARWMSRAPTTDK